MSTEAIMVRNFIKESNLWNRPLNEIRADMEAIPPQGMPEGITNKRVVINDVWCELLLNNLARQEKAILYIHGGGNCLGIYHANREFVALIAKLTGVNIYMPDFRLAPEHPFPAAFEDIKAVYKGLFDLGMDSSNIIVMGDSAGCGLGLSALMELRDNGINMPKAVVCITPMLDCAGKGETLITKAKDDPFQMENALSLIELYVGYNDPDSPKLSPIYGNVTGLPKVLIHAGECDVFLSDSIRLQEKFEAANQKVILKIWKDMWHIFHMQHAYVPEALQALEELCSYINNELNI